jgi:hypothetical protein
VKTHQSGFAYFACALWVFSAQIAFARKKVMAINSFMSWIGGKKALRDEILMRFPASYHRYVEVFGGGGWVLFHKLPGEHDVYNDFNPNLANLFRCVRDKPDELIGELEFTLNSRLDFKHVRQELKTKAETLPDVRRAAYFLPANPAELRFQPRQLRRRAAQYVGQLSADPRLLPPASAGGRGEPGLRAANQAV